MKNNNFTTQSVLYDTGKIRFVEHKMPELAPHELLVRVRATSLNRADLLQRDGRYQPLPEEVQVPGVEIAGEVVACGGAASRFRLGDRIYGVVPGGGFSTYCIVDEGMAMSIPEHWSFIEAAAVAEAGLTADTSLFTVGHLEPGQTVLIHAAASGVGTMAVQMVRQAGAQALCTTGSQGKVDALYALGAEYVFYGHGSKFPHALQDFGYDEVDLIIDLVGGRYFKGNLAALRPGGCLVMVGLLDSFEWHADFVPIINKRLNLHGVVLRKRPIEQRRQVTQDFLRRWSTAIIKGLLKPVISTIHPFSELEKALREMEDNHNIGKIVLDIGD
ncbi:NAD(P)H-quinone oxidoreductase [Pseudomonas citronellolis]|uniref:NAD(P)H-quinone oxidoreductase n=1 Tax=Pseudomonas citronellolis TaxID=53408 RepID=UPI0026490709|nr:NAD(P)H-quinone oxidoreductase [Pseudomonas citronellolis]MDN6875420.1 NAD(P)H-quinone oxidoreductase [Pseudomonas citronellolis]